MGCEFAKLPAGEPLENPFRRAAIFDAHCHYLDYQQWTEGITALLQAMDANDVSRATLLGNPWKKSWVADGVGPSHPIFDLGEFYCFSATDYKVAAHLSTLAPDARARFTFSLCGFNFDDAAAPALIAEALAEMPQVGALGAVPLHLGLITNLTLRGARAFDYMPVAKRALALCAERQPHPLPFSFWCDACSRRVWEDRRKFQYMPELGALLSTQPRTPCLWVGAGVFNGGVWEGYQQELIKLLDAHRNLYISITPDLLGWNFKGAGQQVFLRIAAAYPDRVVLGTTVMGAFSGNSTPNSWQPCTYREQCDRLRSFAQELETVAGAEVASLVLSKNAERFFTPGQGLTPVDVPRLAFSHEDVLAHGHDAKPVAIGYGSSGCYASQKAAPPAKPVPQVWKTIDCHFHLFDFSQKSCGTAAALRALEESHAEKAVVLGIPCCKKWDATEDEMPLFYVDDNCPCYFYSYADQMLADAWLALPMEGRKRLAPMISGFDPTDKNAINHVRRVYEKYPRMWRGLGEVMCRHDDMTTTLLNKEVPRPNHPGMFPVYEFCVQKGLPVLVHSNAERVGATDGLFHYASEVEDVLQKFPDLRFVWCHAGVSRNTAEPNQHELFDRMLSTYANLSVDISWVVWEQCITDADHQVKDVWVQMIEKHCKKVTIGSDLTGQFWSVPDLSNSLKSQITKYWALLDRLSPVAANRVARDNAEEMYFKGWDVPSPDEAARGRDARYAQIPQCYPCEFLDCSQRKYLPGPSVSQDAGDVSF